MQKFPFPRLARIMTTPVAFCDCYQLLASIGQRSHQDVLACTFA
jgi:hypothetical protein